MAANAAPYTRLILHQKQVVEPYRIRQATNEQPAVIRVVDTQVQDEFLLEQPGLDCLYLDQVHLRLAPIVAAPAGATRQQSQQDAEQKHAGLGDHAQLAT